MEKLPFEVVFASSSDEHFPAKCLADQSAPWTSQRFCTFPQSLILHLTCGKSRIRKLQILGHHSMISTRLDIFVGNFIPLTINNRPQASLISQIQFNRIGYVTMDDNQKTGFQARELKSIHLDCFGEYIQIVLEKCHINSLNLFNQVGLVAINMLGEVDENAVARNDPIGPLNSHLSLSEAPADLIQDPTVAKWIRSLVKAKEKAIKSEDFALAKSLKILLDTLKAEGDIISKLEVQKRKSIESEDYDTAKTTKQEIEVKRKELQAIIQQQGFFYDTATNEMVLDSSAAVFAKQLVPAKAIQEAGERLDSESPVANHKNAMDVQPSKPPESESKHTGRIAMEKAMPLEDRPIKTSNMTISLEEFDANSVPPGIEATSSNKPPAKPKMAKPKLSNASEKPPAAGITAVVPSKSKPSEEKPTAVASTDTPLIFCPPVSIPFEDTSPQFDEMNYRSTINLFELPFVNCLCSKDFQAREWAFNYVDERLVKANKLSGKEESVFRKAVPQNQTESVVRSMYEVLQHGLEDNREKVILRSLALWRNLIDFCKQEQIGWLVIAKAVDRCIWLLIQKSVDSPRYQRTVYDFIHVFVETYGSVVHPLFMKPMQQPLLPKFIKSRLNYASEMLSVVDMPAVKSGKSPVSLHDFIAFARSHVDHQAADVRQAVIEYFVAVYRWFVRLDNGTEGATAAARQAITEACSNAKRGVIDALMKGMSAIDNGSDCTQVEYSHGGSKRGSVNNGGSSNSTPAAVPGKRQSLTNSIKSPRIARNNSYAAAEQYQSSPPPAAKANPTKQKPPQQQKTKKPEISSGEIDEELAMSPSSSSVSHKSPKPSKQQRASLVAPPKTRFEDELEEIEETEEPRQRHRQPVKKIAGPPSPTLSKLPLPASKQAIEVTTSGSPLLGGRKTESPYLKRQNPPPKRTEQPTSPAQAKLPAKTLPAKPVGREIDPEILSNQWNIDRTCIFCEQMSTEFTDKNLDQHYWSECPMLTRCQYCQHVVEVASLGDHFLTECAKKEDMKRCPRCSLIVPGTKFEEHLLDARCKVMASGESVCQLCGKNISDGEVGWRRHLRDPPGCSRSNRKPVKPAQSVSSPVSSPLATEKKLVNPTAAVAGSPSSTTTSSKARSPRPNNGSNGNVNRPGGKKANAVKNSASTTPVLKHAKAQKGVIPSASESESESGDSSSVGNRSPAFVSASKPPKNRSFLGNIFSSRKVK